MKYELIKIDRAEDIAKLAVCLTNEIIERTGTKHFDVDVPLAVDLCTDRITSYNVCYTKLLRSDIQ